jgi:hypothetical protein
MESNPELNLDTLVRSTAPHQNVTDPQHWGKQIIFKLRKNRGLQKAKTVHLNSRQKEKSIQPLITKKIFYFISNCDGFEVLFLSCKYCPASNLSSQRFFTSNLIIFNDNPH